MKVALLVEGQSDADTLPILLRKSLGASIAVEAKWVRRGNLLNDRKVAATIDPLLQRHPDIAKIIICVDLECAKDSGTEKSERARIQRVERAVRRRMGKRTQCSVDYIPVTYATEGWLLADPDVIRQYLGSNVTVAIPPSASLDCRPKNVMKELFRKAGREFLETRDNMKIAQRVRIEKILSGNQSFAVFCEKVSDL